MRILSLALGLLVATACDSGDDDKSTTEDDPSDEVPSDTNAGSDDEDDVSDSETEESDPGDGMTPQLSNGEIYCCTIGGDANITTFFVNVDYSDPQGDDTVELGFTTSVEVSGTVVETVPMYACDGEGVCSGSWGESYYDISCSNIQNYEYYALVTDDDGNEGRGALEVLEVDTGC